MTNLAVTTITAFLQPRISNAAWSAENFAGGDFTVRFEQVFEGQIIHTSNEIQITLPTTAENGAVVPFTISSELEQIQRLYLWVEKNPTPLAAEFELSEIITLPITGRIKMAESANVIVIARQGDRLLRNQQWVNVMQGGCGTG